MNNLKIERRSLNKKTHELRSGGIIPGTIYGPTVKNTPIKISAKVLRKATSKMGEVYKVSSGAGELFVKFSEIQKDPISREIMHFSLVEMPGDVENEIEVPLSLTGTPVGVRKGGFLVVIKDEILLHGKPKQIPDNISANISKLDIGEKLTVKDLNIPNRVDSFEDQAEVIAICTPPTKEVPKVKEEMGLLSGEIDEKGSLISKIAGL